VACSPRYRSTIDLAVQLIGETVRLSGAWASVNSKRMSSLARLWQRLNCYRDSLSRPDRERYCREKTAFFNMLVGANGSSVLSRANFCAPLAGTCFRTSPSWITKSDSRRR